MDDDRGRGRAAKQKTGLKTSFSVPHRGWRDQRRQGQAPRSMLLRLRFLFRNMRMEEKVRWLILPLILPNCARR
ncbi:hypothetical protein X961_5602 [Burkholderia pseudomallei MSHR5613]|nr:hypothetical protein DO64_5851 [Burkholderia pseudomallei]KGS37090.1 hypothetical protein X945_5387 [Burkholderia pseudomallei ABCPW 107]KGS40364.1 hypothetical protein X961_5602 [Burkholderia pseudomallei MSHR5613]KGS76185.1 hypothetical protein X947_5223 [Burkholderia pseudomallei MSHR7334]KGX68658.1 hypothetical protein Y026_5053 [Burkholderia pseudomallei TSV28]KOS75621.1 hypothetical protein DM46_1698 [Burkholderia mallei]